MLSGEADLLLCLQELGCGQAKLHSWGEHIVLLQVDTELTSGVLAAREKAVLDEAAGLVARERIIA
ncbi:hypothetical protein E2562_006708 [Oryza meyeriana var. granulata]|uniref:Uncharacterized protein n=1 Tax=Oryza meyeriana var. granulata TaxID=110450 RepID=A0A6G1EG00_9ORYZ|nr:hypothetical protein E2562_006708 [Oryza meyeriana var. granulata]